MKKEDLYTEMRRYEIIAGIFRVISAIFFMAATLNVIYIYSEAVNIIAVLMVIIPVIIGLISSSICCNFEEKALIIRKKLFRKTLKELG